MSCGHGCGHGHAPAYGTDWFHGGCWPDEVDPRIRRGELPVRTRDDRADIDEMEARLAALQRALRRVEAELAEVRGGAGPVDR